MVSRFIPDSFKYGSLVAKAAEDNEVPTAGYLQEELKKLTFDPDACIGVEDALVARLEKRSSNVKLKTLRLIKLLCESGSPNFRRDMQRRVKEVRECLHWQGDPHPTMGDLPNRMVREAAQQVINIVFDAGPHTASSGLGLTSTPAPAVSSPSAPASAPAPPAPQQAPIPAQTQAQAPRPIAASSSPSKYMGFGNDKSSSAPDHKPLSSYFTNTPPPPTAHATGSSPAGLMAPGNTLALMSGGLKTLSTKFTGVSNSSQKPPGAPQEPVGGGEAGGGGSYTGPGAAGATENQTERVARESSAAAAIAAVEAVTAHGAGRATGFDRYGRPVDGAGAHVGGGDVDINTINDIIANLEGGGRAAGAGQAGQAGGLHLPTQTTSHDRVQVPAGGGGGSSLGLEPRAAMLPADDEARLAAAIAASLKESGPGGPHAPGPTAPSTSPSGGLGLVSSTAAAALSSLAPMAEPVRSAAGQFEERLVLDLTTPSGMRVAPAKDDVQQLCVKAKTLDIPLLMMLFCSKLEDSSNSWQTRLRALYCLEALIKCPDEELKKEALRLLQGRVQLVDDLTKAPEKALAEMARKVSSVIRAGTSSQVAGTSSGTAAAGASVGDGLSSLFDGLNVSSGGANAVGGAGGDLALDSLLSLDATHASGAPAPAKSAPIDLLSQLAPTQPKQTADLLSGSPGQRPGGQRPAMMMQIDAGGVPTPLTSAGVPMSAGLGAMHGHGTGTSMSMSMMPATGGPGVMLGVESGLGMQGALATHANLPSGGGMPNMNIMRPVGMEPMGTGVQASSMMGLGSHGGVYGMQGTPTIPNTMLGTGSRQAGGGTLPAQQQAPGAGNILSKLENDFFSKQLAPGAAPAVAGLQQQPDHFAFLAHK